ncbi:MULTISPECIES: acyltransferase family protein [Klebsiella pneumoniae complex]|uniref:acyltransferase family protein n=1 Tax=Klebsiella pneumoniae complex TaxID=3390273 RepID=UPI00190B382C|nr:acyltransferase [Klebsiella quasivariicola]MBK2375545.1 acyltransferase [Klebsiella quasivariicola]HDT6500546.1 acyltransferase [Klebsiella pneumoniae]
MKNEIRSLQIVRAVAAISVVLNHLIGASPGSYLFFTRSIGNVGVDLFFVLSGLIMIYTLREEETSWSFLKKRIIRIYPTYFVLSLPIAIYFIYKNNPSIADIVSNITLIPQINNSFDRFNIVNWTLIFEMYFYIIMSFSLLFSKNKWVIALITSAIIISIMALLPNSGTLAYVDLSMKSVVSDYIIVDFIFGMFIGLYLNSKPLIFSSGPFRPLASAALFVISSLLMTFSSEFDFSNNPQIKTLILSGIPSAIIVIMISKYNSQGYVFAKLKEIGDASYSIYLTHTSIRLVAWRFESTTIRLFFSVVAIFFGVICHLLIEKRILNFFKKNKKPKIYN